MAVGTDRGWDLGWINLNWVTSATQFIFLLLKLIKFLVSLLSLLIEIKLLESLIVTRTVSCQLQNDNFFSYEYTTTISMARAFILFAGFTPQLVVSFACFKDQEVVWWPPIF